MTTISEHYNLGKSQLELDFVDVFIEKNQDLPLFIDPWAIHTRTDELWIEMYNLINSYFQKIIDYIRLGNEEKAKELLSYTSECKEIKLWVWKWWYWKWLWWEKYIGKIIDSLKNSKAVKSWSIKDIEDMILIIDWISYDRVSDMIWNILKLKLIEYTEEQCRLLWIPMFEHSWVIIWNGEDWESMESCSLPFVDNVWWLIFVPKSIVRKWKLAINDKDFYRKYILPYEQTRYLNMGSSLCRILKNWEKKVCKKDLEDIITEWKQTNEKYIIDNPELLQQYKIALKKEDYNDSFLDLFYELEDRKEWKNEKEKQIVENLIEDLDSIVAWKDNSEFHNFIVWALLYIFHPNLQNPKKELPLFEWNKRVDISMINTSNSWIFSEFAKRTIPCQKVYFECKNYTHDLENPEYDQLYWRFTDKTTRVWFVVCRNIKNKEKMGEKLKIYADKQNAYICVLSDEDIIQLLRWRSNWRYDLINKLLKEHFDHLIED